MIASLRRALIALSTTAAMCAAGAAAPVAAQADTSCPSAGLSQPFAQWGDQSSYELGARRRLRDLDLDAEAWRPDRRRQRAVRGHGHPRRELAVAPRAAPRPTRRPPASTQRPDAPVLHRRDRERHSSRPSTAALTVPVGIAAAGRQLGPLADPAHRLGSVRSRRQHRRCRCASPAERLAADRRRVHRPLEPRLTGRRLRRRIDSLRETWVSGGGGGDPDRDRHGGARLMDLDSYETPEAESLLRSAQERYADRGPASGVPSRPSS